MPAGKPIPAHLFGNMWAQQWDAIYDLLEPYPGVSNSTSTRRSSRQGYDADPHDEVRRGRSTNRSASRRCRRRSGSGPCSRSRATATWSATPAPGTSTATRTCASRCASSPTEEDLRTIYHEMGHVYYYLWYKNQPFLFQGGAHDGFHEAIGDTITSLDDARLPREDRAAAGGAGRARRPRSTSR